MPNLDLLGPWQVLLGQPIHENGTSHVHKQCFFFLLSSYMEGSFSLNCCINGKVAFSFSTIRSIVIFVEDGEGVPSFRFFSA